MIRSVFAVLSSYVALSVSLFLLFAVAFFDVPQGTELSQLRPTMLFQLVALAWGLVSAIGAGWLVGLLAGRHPMEHGLALAAFAGLVGVASLAATLGDLSLGFQVGNLVVLMLGTTIGGWLRAARVQARSISTTAASAL
jgi:hypothetical protein